MTEEQIERLRQEMDNAGFDPSDIEFVSGCVRAVLRESALQASAQHWKTPEPQDGERDKHTWSFLQGESVEKGGAKGDDAKPLGQVVDERLAALEAKNAEALAWCRGTRVIDGSDGV